MVKENPSFFTLLKKNTTVHTALFGVVVFLGVLWSYQYIFQTFFAMDEWSFWNLFLRYGPFHTIINTGVVGSLTGGIRLGLLVTNDIFFSLFGLNVLPWNITFLALHFINTFLLYAMLRKFKLSPFSSSLAAFYFAIASAGQEALSWPAAGMQVLGTTPFILGAILLTIKFNETKKKLYVVLAILCSYLSFLMRPTGIVTPALIVALIFFFYKRDRVFRLPGIVGVLAVTTFLLGLRRLLIEYSGKMHLLVQAGIDIIMFPLVSLAHIFVPIRLMFKITDGFIAAYYPIIAKDSNIETISHLVVGDYFATIISFFILVLLYVLYRHVDAFYKKTILFGLIVFFVQYIVIALFYIDRGGLSYLASRHTYTSLAGLSLILGILFDSVRAQFKTKNAIQKYVVVGFFVLVGCWLGKEMMVTKREVRAQAMDDVAIKKTWDALRSLKLPNSNKMVFYITSDRNYFYPDWYLPFKLPAAYMLSLAFYGRPFIDKAVLGDLQKSNNYISSNNTQYGYFTDMKPLIARIKNGEIDITNVVGFHFKDGSYTFEDRTQQTREMIEKELQNLK
jgi:hypothetical protein